MGGTVGELIDEAVRRYGVTFRAACALPCRVWVNGEPSTTGAEIGDLDEVAFLPPVSGG